MLPAVTGSPAWAGIDPPCTALATVWTWFPRVGGDRPYKEIREMRAMGVPPRGRG